MSECFTTVHNFCAKETQTFSLETRQCGFVEVSLDNSIYILNCFHCADEYPIWNWEQFVRHVNDEHLPPDVNVEIISNNGDEEQLSRAAEAASQIEATAAPELVDGSLEPPGEAESDEFDEYEKQCEDATIFLNEETTDSTSLKPLNIEADLNYAINENTSEAKASPVEDQQGRPQKTTISQRKLPPVCDICNKSFRTWPICKQHRKLHQKPTYNCDQCPRAYHRACLLREHKRVHELKHEFICEECGRSFRRKQAMQEHLRGVHQRMIKCHICGVTYANFKSVLRHLKRDHLVLEGTNEDLARRLIPTKFKQIVDPITFKAFFVCDVCGKKFPGKHPLGVMTHMVRQHSYTPVDRQWRPLVNGNATAAAAAPPTRRKSKQGVAKASSDKIENGDGEEHDNAPAAEVEHVVYSNWHGSEEMQEAIVEIVDTVAN